MYSQDSGCWFRGKNSICELMLGKQSLETTIFLGDKIDNFDWWDVSAEKGEESGWEEALQIY